MLCKWRFITFYKARKLSPGGKTSHLYSNVLLQYNYGRALRWYREVKRQLTDMQNYFIAKRHAVTNFLYESFPRNNWNITFIMNTYAQKNRLAFICLKEDVNFVSACIEIIFCSRYLMIYQSYKQSAIHIYNVYIMY